MKKSLIVFFFILNVMINSFCENDQNSKITVEKQSQDQINIPKNLDECFKTLDAMLEPESKQKMKSLTEIDMIVKYHFGLGLWIRNSWNLWSESELKKYFNSIGVFHPDDMSGVILRSYWRYLNGKPIELENQVKYYQDFWKAEKVSQRD